MGISATWGGGDGDWFDAGNWTEPNPDGTNVPVHYVPDTANDAIFNGTVAYTVTFDGLDSVDGINAFDDPQSDDLLVTLAIAGGSLTVGADGGALGLLSTSAGATFALSDSSFFRIVTAIDNAGTIEMNAAGDSTRLYIGFQTTPSPVMLTGGGSIVMSDSANNDIFIDNDASLDNVDNTISGAGAISSNFTSLTNGAAGVIDATGHFNNLVLSVPNVTNQGTIEDTGTAGLQLSSSGVSTLIDNEGGVIAAIGTGAHVDVGSGTLIAGGTLSSSGGGVIQVTNDANGNILDGADDGALTIAQGSTVSLEDGSALELTGTSANAGVIVNMGTIALDAGADRTQLSGHGGGTTMLTGGGQITLSDSANNIIGGGDFGTVFDNVDNTISGAGVIDSVAGRLSLTNGAQGVIDATGSDNALSVQNITLTNMGILEDTGTAGLSLADATVNNAGGTIEATGAGAHVDLVNNGIGGTTITGGTLSTSGGGVINIASSTAALEGSVTVAGAIAGAGTLAVASGKTTFASGSALTTTTFNVQGGAEADIVTPLVYAGALNNTGTVTLDGNDTFELSGSVSGSGAIDFASQGAATLKLDAAALPNGQTFSNTVGNFAFGDVIDLSGLTFTGNVTPTYDSNSGTLTVSEGGLTDTLILSAPDATNFTLQSDSAGGTELVCFASGALIRTGRGDVAVEKLAIGDMVVTASGEHRPIRWIGHRKVDCRSRPLTQNVLPVRISAHAFGESRPARDLYLSPAHAVCIDILGEILVPISSLLNGATIRQVAAEKVTYWHVELDSHDILLAENLATESYLEVSNRGFFLESEVVDLKARLDAPRASTADFCRPFHVEGPLVEAVRSQLCARAKAMGWRMGARDDFHLLAGQVRLEPNMRGHIATFRLPRGDFWLVCETTRPFDVGINNDRRDLGLAITGIRYGDGDKLSRRVELDDPALVVGFYPIEGREVRWTGRRALFPAKLFAALPEASLLSIELVDTPLPRWIAPEEAAQAQVA